MSRNTERKRQANDLDSEVRKLVREMDQVWLRVGRLCAQCKSERLYQELGFERFDDWINDAVGMSRSRAYVAMRAARDLVPIRDTELNQMTMQNAEILSHVPKSRQPALVEAAISQTERVFRETVAVSVPGLHLEANVHVEFWVPRSLLEVIERCIKKAMVVNEIDSRTAAVEAIFPEYDVGHADPEKEREAEQQEVSSK
jgi:hypothetical protein